MFVQPDSALQIMWAVDRSRITHEGVLARYALRYTQALDRNQILADDDSLARIATDYYVNRGTPEERTAAFYYLGCIYSNAGRQQDAAEAIVKAEVFSRDLGDENPYLRGLVYHAMGVRYCVMKGGRADGASYYQRALEAFTQTGNCFNMGCAYRELALIGYYTGKGSVALRNMRRAIECFEKSPVSSEPMLAYQRHREKAFHLLFDSTYTDKARKDSLWNYLREKPEWTAPEEYRLLTSLYVKENNLDSARWSAWRTIETAGGEPIWRSWVYADLSKIEETAGNFRQALDYYRQSAVLADSVEKVRHFSMAASLSQRLEAEALQHEYRALRTRHHYLYLVTGLTLLVILLLGWHLVQVTRRWRLRLQAHQQAEAVRFEETAKRLSAAYDELKAQYESLRDQQHASSVDDEREAHFNEALEMRLGGLKRLMDKACVYRTRPTAFFNAFAAFAMVSPNSKKEVWADLQYVVNKKFGGVVDYLRTNYPSLSSRDLDLCCLICFGFSPSGICFIYGYEDMGTLYNKRSRLRQKLGLTELKLEDFLAELCITLTRRNVSESEKNDTDASLPVAG